MRSARNRKEAFCASKGNVLTNVSGATYQKNNNQRKKKHQSSEGKQHSHLKSLDCCVNNKLGRELSKSLPTRGGGMLAGAALNLDTVIIAALKLFVEDKRLLRQRLATCKFLISSTRIVFG